MNYDSPRDQNILRCNSSSSYSSSNNNNNIDVSHYSSEAEALTQWERFQRRHAIGSGSFANVFLCYDILPTSPLFHQPVAVKVISLQSLSDSEVALAMNEVAILKHLEHNNILQYIDSFIDEEKQLCLVSEYAAGGDLASLLRHCSEEMEGNKGEYFVSDSYHNSSNNNNNNSSAAYSGIPILNESLKFKTKTKTPPHHKWIESYRITDIVRQCLEALSYLHSCYIIHRDIKPANIYLTKTGIIKLGDFGVSRLVNINDPMAATFIGTPFYLCPELCLGESYSFGADIWALGTLTYEMYCMKLPFAADNVLAQIHVVTEGEYDRETLYKSRIFNNIQLKELEIQYGKGFIEQEEALHRLVITLVERMLVVDPMQRPTAAQLLQEYFFPGPSRCPSPLSYIDIRNNNNNNNYYSKVYSKIVSHSPSLPPRMQRISSSITSSTSAALLLASRVNTSFEELSEELPRERRDEILHKLSRPSSSNPLFLSQEKQEKQQQEEEEITPPLLIQIENDSSLSKNTISTTLSSLPSNSSSVMDLDVAIRSATRQIITETIDKIPWLRHAEIFSSLSLQEGYDDDVVRVDWMDEDHFSLISPHKRLCLSSQHGKQETEMLSLEKKVSVSTLRNDKIEKESGKNIIAREEEKEEEKLRRPSLSSLGIPTPPNPSLISTANSQYPQNNNTVTNNNNIGRCQGIPTETLEAMMRRKIMTNYVRRQWRLKAMREANAAREEENLRLRAELNELYAKSFSEKRLSMTLQKEEENNTNNNSNNDNEEETAVKEGTTSPTKLFASTQRPLFIPMRRTKTPTSSEAATIKAAMNKTDKPNNNNNNNNKEDTNEYSKTNIIEKTLKNLNLGSLHSKTVKKTLNSASLTAEVMRIAKDAAAVAERCAKWAIQPPKRLDFSKIQIDDVDRRSTSSLEDSLRGFNTQIYDIPVTLCIVRTELDVTPPQFVNSNNNNNNNNNNIVLPVGSLELPISISLKSIRRRTRLDGIVWRVKKAIKAYGLEHALLFPLDIDNTIEVDAEELHLRYIDRVGDVIAITEASDWSYVMRDWRGRVNLPWLQIYMVKP